MWKLVIEDDEGKRTVVPLTRDDYTIGRQEGNSIRLTERNVSREHAKLQKRNGERNGNGAPDVAYVLEDMTSYNGVYINGLRVAQTQELAHGDLIQIGDYRIILQDDVSSEADAAPPYDSEELKATMPQVAGLETLLSQPNRLIMLAGPNPGAEFPLTGERLTIGRAEEATISVNHNSVSRLHCEVHALGEGRFEIVDKGSSNGVRLNGADLRRGIIEAGDIIELGDVKFKFVGQGQIFRPGASESQQLAAMSHRSGDSIGAGGRRRASLAPYVVLGAVVGIAVAGWFYWHPATRGNPVASPETMDSVTPPSGDAATVLDAKHLCDQGDCETAHQRISRLADTSVARTTQEFKDVEFKWATMILLRADGEQDTQTKRSLLERVTGTPTVDPALRSTANDRLSSMQSVALVAATTDAGRATAAAPAPRSQPSDPQSTQPTAHTPPAAAQTAAPKSAFDRASAYALSGDTQKARDILSPRVFGKRASKDEVNLLIQVCKAQKDHECVQAIQSLTP